MTKMSVVWNKPKTSPREFVIPQNKTFSRPRKDVVVSELEQNSIRWMTNRRNSKSTVIVLSTEQQNKFKQIFNAFDFEGEGDLTLNDLNNSLDWISKSPYFSSKAQIDLLHDLQNVFTAMDTGGDGSVNFSEFCIGMTGTASKVINKLDKFESAKLFDMILQYANTIKRNQSLSKISEKEDSNNISSDKDMIQYFNVLFSLPISKEKALYMCDDDLLMKKETSSSNSLNTPIKPGNKTKPSKTSPRARKIITKPSSNNDTVTPIKQIVNPLSVEIVESINNNTITTTTTTNDNNNNNNDNNSNELIKSSSSEQFLKASILEHEEKEKKGLDDPSFENNKKSKEFFASLKLDLENHNLNTDN
jgi:Ca2+-binding EF-hand superfamily protein